MGLWVLSNLLSPGFRDVRFPHVALPWADIGTCRWHWFAIYELSALAKDGDKTTNVALGKPVEVGGEKVTAPTTVWVRVRAFNKRGPSLWDVVQVQCNR